MQESAITRPSFDRKQLIAPLLLLLFALLIRLPGITWGLKDQWHNQSFHPDEELNFRHSREIEPAHLSFVASPHGYAQFYSYGTLYFTAMRVVDDVMFGYGGGSDHPNDDWDYIRRGELGGRIISLVAGSLLCLVAYFTAKRFTSEFGAIAAGLTLAVAPGLVVHSRFATVDMTATLFVALAGLYSLKILMDKDPEWMRWAILAGVCAGLSAGTKYTGILSLLMPLTALAIKRPPKAILLAASTVLASVLAFVVSTPGCLLDTDRFVSDVKYEMAHTSAGHGMVFTGTSSGFLYHLSNLALGVGSILLLLGAWGVIWAIIQKKSWPWVLLAFSIPYYITIGQAEVKFMRYVFPLTVGLAAGVGFAMGEGNTLRKGYSTFVVLGILGIGGIEGGGLRGTSTFTFAMAGGLDNRENAGIELKTASDPTKNEALRASGKSDISVGLISDPWFWSPTLYSNITLGLVSPRIKDELMHAATHPTVVRYEPDDGSAPLQYDPRLVTETKPDYITYSDFETLYVDRVAQMPHVPDEFLADVERYKAFTTALSQNYKLETQCGDVGDMVEDMRYVMPTVYVWKRKN